MTTTTMPDSVPIRRPFALLLRTWLLIAVVDGSWAIALTLAYGRSVARLWQGLAATPLGATMFDGGAPAVLLGILIHFSVAFIWSAVFLAATLQSAALRRVLAAPTGMVAVSAVYGPMIWVVMSAIVVPAFTHKPVDITYRWWIQCAGHIVFVGLPIVGSIARGLATSAGQASGAPAYRAMP